MRRSRLGPLPRFSSLLLLMFVCLTASLATGRYAGAASTSDPAAVSRVGESQRALAGATTQVPDLRKLSLGEARDAAKRAGLGVESRGVSPSDEARAVVVSQSPGPGSRVARGMVVRVVAQIRGLTKPGAELLSRGAVVESHRVPNLLKESLDRARDIAARHGFAVRVEGAEPADRGRAVVVWQTPTADEVAPPRSAIAVQVREVPPRTDTPPAEKTARVPELRHRTLLDARGLAAKAGVTLPVRRGPAEEERQLVVIEQRPAPGTVVPAGSPVAVELGKAPPVGETTVVPEVLRLPLLAARARLNDARLSISIRGDRPQEPGRAVVIQQDPPARAKVPVGSTVSVTVKVAEPGRPPGLARVPELRKRSLPEARGLVDQAHLTLSLPRRAAEDERQLVVVEQKPAPGTAVPAGSPVAVRVEKLAPPAPEITVVPEVLRLPLLAAEVRLKDARLSIRIRGPRPADPARAVVIQQDPAAGSRVPVGTPVGVIAQVAEPEPLPEVARVPDLRRRSLLEARGLVERERLALGIPSRSPDDERQLVVVEQKPAPGTAVPPGSAVAVRVEKAAVPSPGPAPGTTTATPPGVPLPGQVPETPAAATAPPTGPPRERPVRVPLLVDRTMEAARDLASASQLGLRIVGERSPGPTRAIVTGQEPRAGTEVVRGSTVTVTVRFLGEPVRVPALVSLTLDEAHARARQVTLDLDVGGEVPREVRWARVVSQDPPADREVEAGSRVQVRVEPVLVEVPELRQRNVAEARRLIDPVGLGLELMGRPPEDESRAVISEQHPPAGTKRPAGSTLVVRAVAAGLPAWAWTALVTAGAGMLGGVAAGVARAIKRTRASRGQPKPAPPFRVEVGGNGWWQESAGDGPALALPALRLRVNPGSDTETVDEALSIVAEERAHHVPG